MDKDVSIRLEKMFCPANDRNVPILIRHDGSEAPDSPGQPVTCLDYGFRCTGWLCPHFASPERPGEGLLEMAIKSESSRGSRGAVERRSVLERALKENREIEARPLL